MNATRFWALTDVGVVDLAHVQQKVNPACLSDEILSGALLPASYTKKFDTIALELCDGLRFNHLIAGRWRHSFAERLTDPQKVCRDFDPVSMQMVTFLFIEFVIGAHLLHRSLSRASIASLHDCQDR